jgi:8-oxo-dGTP pyrophosphatase MutT (NUDIX family)
MSSRDELASRAAAREAYCEAAIEADHREHVGRGVPSADRPAAVSESAPIPNRDHTLPAWASNRGGGG